MGYTHVATHKTKAVELWKQGDITYVLNAEPNSFAARFVEDARPLRPVDGVARCGCSTCV